MKEYFPKTKYKVDQMFNKEEKTPYELIVCKCFDCCAYNPCCCKSLTNNDFHEAVDSIKHCENGTCVLAGYATQKRMFPEKQRKKRELTEEHREKLRQNVKKAQEARLNKNF